MKAHKRRSNRCIRNKLNSPGRPPVWLREQLRCFWQAIATGQAKMQHYRLSQERQPPP